MAQASIITKRLKRTPVSIHISHRLREGAFIVCLALTAYLLLSLLSYTPIDPGWSHTSNTEIIHNKGGRIGAWLADLMLYLLGRSAYLLPIMVAYSGFLARSSIRLGPQSNYLIQLPWVFKIVGFVLALGAACGLAAFYFPVPAGTLPVAEGGVFGEIIKNGLWSIFGPLGATLLLLAFFITGITLFTRMSWLRLMDVIGYYTLDLFQTIMSFGKPVRNSPTHHSFYSRAAKLLKINKSTADIEKREHKVRIDPILVDEGMTGGMESNAASIEDSNSIEVKESLEAIEAKSQISIDKESIIEKKLEMELSALERESPVAEKNLETRINATAKIHIVGEEIHAVRARPSSPIHLQESQRSVVFLSPERNMLPPLSLLDKPCPSQGGYSEEFLEALSRQVEEKLKDFGVEVQVVAVHPGPVITRFELQLAPGVKVSRISGLAKDLARALSVLSVRVVEVIPGKPVIGLEIPNENRDIVRLSEVLSCPDYTGDKLSLALALGKDISGYPVMVDLAKMPHLLVAGTTGSGKSVAIHAMVLSLLYKTTPQMVRLILIDPKMLELSVYEGIPHLLAPVVIDMNEAGHALRWCVAEMERRYRLMAALGVRNLVGFNHKVKEAIRANQPLTDPLYSVHADGKPSLLDPLPLIVVVIDELADMMMVVGKKVEELIARLAQKARASGIHLILATQRPSVDVITGLIKANIPARIAFQVSSRIDSRTILDQMGAEQLLGQGDMLYLAPGTSMPERVHGAFVDDHEVHNVVGFLKRQGVPVYLEEITRGAGDLGDGVNLATTHSGEAEDDPLYDQAVRIVTETQRASVSGVQRRLRIGYNRAARIVEAMESTGVVGPMQANGSREVLASPPPE